MSERDEEPSKIRRIRRLIIGPPRDVSDPQIFHHISLIAFFAWVGLGADGLSSSAYGPEEAYKALGPHYHLSIILVAMTAVTITVIAIAYSNLIQHFPGGGGGYLVASKLLGNKVGVVSGCALLVDPCGWDEFGGAVGGPADLPGAAVNFTVVPGAGIPGAPRPAGPAWRRPGGRPSRRSAPTTTGPGPTGSRTSSPASRP